MFNYNRNIQKAELSALTFSLDIEGKKVKATNVSKKRKAKLEEKLQYAKKKGKLPKIVIPVHFGGQPCDMKEIYALSKKYNFKIIEDAAHAFGVEVNGESIGNFGDITMFSFHPTKLFHTGEGGALVFNDPNLRQRIEYLKNFGIKSEEEVLLPGINGKMGELQAAMGLNVLPLVKQEQEKRAFIRKI